MTGLFISADVGVGPAVELALADAGEKVRDESVAESVAFLNGGPELLVGGIEADGDGVAQAGGEDPVAGAVGKATDANYSVEQSQPNQHIPPTETVTGVHLKQPDGGAADGCLPFDACAATEKVFVPQFIARMVKPGHFAGIRV